MKLAIPAFTPGKPIPRQFTCDGQDRSPGIEWTDPPAGTQSFALIVDDPDAPAGIFAHWGAYDIAATSRGLDEGAGNAAGAPFREARNDFGVQGYRGPCPPRGHGAHRYRFKLYALDVAKLAVGSSPGIADLERAAEGHVLGSAMVTGSFERR